MTNLKYCARSDIGLVRSCNEDAYAVGGYSDEHLGSLFVVCDGMGGQGAGDIAAQLAASIVIEAYYASKTPDRGAALVEAFSTANQRVCQLAKPAYGGTTATAALIVEGKLYFAHVGDSRAYLFLNDQLRRISKDHTYVEALIAQGYLTLQQTHVYHVADKLLRVLGQTDRIDIDLFEEMPKEDVVVLLCTDGVWGWVEDAEIERTIRENPLQDVVGHLIDQANARGGRDNATAVLIWRDE